MYFLSSRPLAYPFVYIGYAPFLLDAFNRFSVHLLKKNLHLPNFLTKKREKNLCRKYYKRVALFLFFFYRQNRACIRNA